MHEAVTAGHDSGGPPIPLPPRSSVPAKQSRWTCKDNSGGWTRVGKEESWPLGQPEKEAGKRSEETLRGEGKAWPERAALPLPSPGAEPWRPLELAEVALSGLSSRPSLLGTEPAPCSLPSRQNIPGQGGATQSPRWATELPQRLHLGGEPQRKAPPIWV